LSNKTILEEDALEFAIAAAKTANSNARFFSLGASLFADFP